MTRFKDWRFLAAIVPFAAAMPLSAANDILKIEGPAKGLAIVEVYKDIEAEEVAGELANDSFPLNVQGISKNLMIGVKTSKVTGWVFPFHVRANFNVEDVGPCNYTIATAEAAPRAIGRNCEVKKK